MRSTRPMIAAQHLYVPRSPDDSLVEMKNGPHNLMRLLRSGGASREAARSVIKDIGQWGAQFGPFDHGVIYGKHGRPLLLMGAPYHMGDADADLLQRIEALGLDVTVSEGSSYGHGTLDVRVYARDGWLPPGCPIG